MEAHKEAGSEVPFWNWKPGFEQDYLPVKRTIRVVKHAELNGVRFSKYNKKRTTDNSCVACRYQAEEGQTEVAYGTIRRIFEHELGGAKSLVFEVVWLENNGICPRTLLPVVDKVWNF